MGVNTRHLERHECNQHKTKPGDTQRNSGDSVKIGNLETCKDHGFENPI